MPSIKEILTESSTKSDMKIFLNSDEFKSKVEKIVKEKLKSDPELEDKMLEISKNVLTQLYKTLWVKRGVWRDNLKNKSN